MADDQFNEQIVISADTTGALSPLQQLEQTTRALDEAGKLMGDTMQRALLAIETGAPRAVAAFSPLVSSVQGLTSQVNLLNAALAQTFALMAQMRGLAGGGAGIPPVVPPSLPGGAQPLLLGPSSALASQRLQEIPLEYQRWQMVGNVPVIDVGSNLPPTPPIPPQPPLLLGPGEPQPQRPSPYQPYVQGRLFEEEQFGVMGTRTQRAFDELMIGRATGWGYTPQGPQATSQANTLADSRRALDEHDRAQKNVMASMIRHIAVYWVLFRAIKAVTGAMETLSQRVLDVDSAARHIQFITGGTYAQGQQAAMAGMDTASRYGLDPQAAIAASIQAARFAPRNQAYQAQLLEQSAQISVLTGERQTETMMQMIEIGRQWNLQQSDMARLGDILAYTYRTSTVDMDQFTDSLSQGASVGQALNLSLDETAGLIAGISEASGRGPTRSITMLSMAAGLENRPEGEAKLWDIGISTRDAQGRLLSIMQILDQIHAKWSQLNRDQQTMAAIGLMGPRYIPDFILLMNNYDAIIAKINGVNNAHREMAKVTEAAMGSMQKQLDRIVPSFQAAFTKQMTPSEDTARGFASFFQFIADHADAAANALTRFIELTYLITAPHLAILGELAPGIAGLIGSRTDNRPWWQKTKMNFGEVGPDLPSGYRRPDTTTTTTPVPMETPEQSRLFKALTDAKLTYKDITKQELDQEVAAAERMADAYLQYLSQQYRGAELVEKQKEEWAQSATIIRTIDGQYTLITGKAAALLNVVEQTNKAMKPSIETMPELNSRTSEMLQRYITQYEQLLTKLGIKQTPEEYLIFGQGGTLYKYTTSSEAMTLAMELLREEIRKNTEKMDESLRGSYNIPTAFGYVPPTPWDYYAAGNHDMGPVNYPWMFGGGPVDQKGKPLIGSPATGITKEFTSTLLASGLAQPVSNFGIHVDKFGSHVDNLTGKTVQMILGSVSDSLRIAKGIVRPSGTTSGAIGAEQEPMPYLFDHQRLYAYEGGESATSSAGGAMSMQGILSAVSGTQANTAAMANRIPFSMDRVGNNTAIANFLLQGINSQLVRIGALLNRPIVVNVYTVSGTAGGTVGSGTPASTSLAGFGQGYVGANTVSAVRL